VWNLVAYRTNIQPPHCELQEVPDGLPRREHGVQKFATKYHYARLGYGCM